jgi:hypothetical protein
VRDLLEAKVPANGLPAHGSSSARRSVSSGASADETNWSCDGSDQASWQILSSVVRCLSQGFCLIWTLDMFLGACVH